MKFKYYYSIVGISFQSYLYIFTYIYIYVHYSIYKYFFEIVTSNLFLYNIIQLGVQ